MGEKLESSAKPCTKLPHAVVITGGIACGKSSVCAILRRKGFAVICADTIAHAVLDECADELVKRFGDGIMQRAQSGKGCETHEAHRAGQSGQMRGVGGEHKASKIDRVALGEIVFSSAQKRKELEMITHPRIYEQILHQAQALESKILQESKRESTKKVCGKREASAVESCELDSRLADSGTIDPRAKQWYFLDIPLFFESGGSERYGVKHIICVSAPQELQIARLRARSGLSPDKALARIQAQMPLVEKAARSAFVIDNSGTFEKLESSIESMLTHLERR